MLWFAMGLLLLFVIYFVSQNSGEQLEPEEKQITNNDFIKFQHLAQLANVDIYRLDNNYEIDSFDRFINSNSYGSYYTTKEQCIQILNMVIKHRTTVDNKNEFYAGLILNRVYYKVESKTVESLLLFLDDEFIDKCEIRISWN